MRIFDVSIVSLIKLFNANQKNITIVSAVKSNNFATCPITTVSHSSPSRVLSSERVDFFFYKLPITTAGIGIV